MSQQSGGFHPVVSQQMPDAHAEGDGKGEACSGAGGCSRKGTAAACGATAEALAGSRICWGVPRANFRCSHDVGRRSEEHTSELQSRLHLVCRLLLEKKNNT